MKSAVDSGGIAPDLAPVTPNDGVDLPRPARAIRCRPDGEGGALRITTASGDVRNTHIVAGERIPVQILRVHDTGTDATSLEVFF